VSEEDHVNAWSNLFGKVDQHRVGHRRGDYQLSAELIASPRQNLHAEAPSRSRLA
jgi:hypothetical protein